MFNNVLVKRCDLCQYLLDKGYRIVSIARDKKIRNQTVFYFKDENNIRDVIEMYYLTKIGKCDNIYNNN